VSSSSPGLLRCLQQTARGKFSSGAIQVSVLDETSARRSYRRWRIKLFRATYEANTAEEPTRYWFERMCDSLSSNPTQDHRNLLPIGILLRVQPSCVLMKGVFLQTTPISQR